MVGAVEEEADGFFAAIPIVEGEFVDVHADEFVGEFAVEAASERESVFNPSGAVVEAVLDALVENFGELGDPLFAE